MKDQVGVTCDELSWNFQFGFSDGKAFDLCEDLTRMSDVLEGLQSWDAHLFYILDPNNNSILIY